jgi:dihydroneopterin aldolase
LQQKKEMLTVSLHNIRIHGKHGLFPEEAVLGNWFEVDVDVKASTSEDAEWPFIDYGMINKAVHDIFISPTKLLETLVKKVHTAIKAESPAGAIVRVAIRKMHPPVPGDVGYSQVCYEA